MSKIYHRGNEIVCFRGEDGLLHRAPIRYLDAIDEHVEYANYKRSVSAIINKLNEEERNNNGKNNISGEV